MLYCDNPIIISFEIFRNAGKCFQTSIQLVGVGYALYLAEGGKGRWEDSLFYLELCLTLTPKSFDGTTFRILFCPNINPSEI